MNMRILFISVFRDSTGWAIAAQQQMLALDAVGVDVVARSIKLNNVNGEVHKKVLGFAQKDLKGIDIVIQHVLPFMPVRNGLIDRNIILYDTETSHTQWASRINQMDEAWVINRHAKQASRDSGVEIPIQVVPHPTDITKYMRSYTPLNFREELGDKFIFYVIGEIHPRKNITALIRAFHAEFDPNEPVELLIKTTPMNGINSVDQLREFINSIKAKMYLYSSTDSYKQEILIVDYWKEDQINQLHNSCDAFVCSSSGEAWSIPTFDAMGFGRSVICPESTGFLDYMSEETGWMIQTGIEPMFDVPSARENWYPIDIDQLRRSMRSVYENKEERKKRAIAGRKRALDFSYEKVGTLMKGILEQ